MHEYIKGMCPEIGFMRDREWLDKRCPGCKRLETCSTGQAMKTVKAFEKEGRTSDLERRTGGVGVEAALDAMKVPPMECGEGEQR